VEDLEGDLLDLQHQEVMVDLVEVVVAADLIDQEELVTLHQYLPHKVNLEEQLLQVHQETKWVAEVVVLALQVEQLHLLLEEEMEEMVQAQQLIQQQELQAQHQVLNFIQAVVVEVGIIQLHPEVLVEQEDQVAVVQLDLQDQQMQTVMELLEQLTQAEEQELQIL
jgi:hypothetical protein